MIRYGDNRCAVTLKYFDIGEDLLVIITGGKEHIGAISLMDNGLYSSVVKSGHKDEMISKFVIKTISSVINKDIAVTCGIHIDNATKDEIETIFKNTEKCIEKFISIYRR